jgi:flagellar basal-body rod protein FlgC
MLQLLPGIKSATAALSAERLRLDVVGQNIANAQTTHGTDGKPYRRQVVSFESFLDRTDAAPGSQGVPSVRVSKVEADNRPARSVYIPGHPDADAQGMVKMPDISIHEEMADMIAASRAYEANLAVVKTSRTLALQALSIGKH